MIIYELFIIQNFLCVGNQLKENERATLNKLTEQVTLLFLEDFVFSSICQLSNYRNISFPIVYFYSQPFF